MSEPTKREIDAALDKCAELQADGKDPWPSMTYIDGVRDAIEWLQGEGEHPLAELYEG